MPRIEIIKKETKAESTYLCESAHSIHSQFGEEGIIEKVFEIIGHARTNKWCVEFGAWDGILFSNTCWFICEHGWHAVQIEAHPARFAELKRNFANYSNTVQIKGLVGYAPGVDSIDDFLSDSAIPVDFDFISIDIDGNDWHVWNSMQRYQPRLVVIEFNPKVPNDVIFVQDRDHRVHQGCSLAALIALGKSKGYELICAHHVNAFFCLAEDFPKFRIADNSIDAMFTSPPGRIFECYDGTIYNTLAKPMWTLERHSIQPETFQLLARENRVWPPPWA